LVLRFRGARGIERQQLKWFLLAAGCVVASVLGALALSIVELTGWAFDILYVFGIWIGIPVVIPTVTGIAILRHNLYDIDLIINRALVYLALTVSLVVSYLALVLSLGWLLRTLTGQSSSVVTAASTLGVAALFQPLRHWIQGGVDRRFYRSRYDAARVVERFGERLRDEVDLATLGAELHSVATQTMQPAHVSLWLRPADRGRA
jgi:hypothetical protein